jgi:hypothetical protein
MLIKTEEVSRYLAAAAQTDVALGRFQPKLLAVALWGCGSRHRRQPKHQDRDGERYQCDARPQTSNQHT